MAFTLTPILYLTKDHLCFFFLLFPYVCLSLSLLNLPVEFSSVFSNTEDCTVAGCLFMLWNDLAPATRPEGKSCRKLPESACFDFGIIQEMRLSCGHFSLFSNRSWPKCLLLFSIALISVSVTNSDGSSQRCKTANHADILVPDVVRLRRDVWTLFPGSTPGVRQQFAVYL